MNDANAYLSKLIAAADERGWMLVGYSGQKPCSVTLADRQGTTITIAEPYGLTLEQYIGRLEAIEPRQIKVVEA